MSSEKRPNDSADEPRSELPAVSGEKHPVQQGAGEASTPDAASGPAQTKAAPGVGWETADSPPVSATPSQASTVYGDDHGSQNGGPVGEDSARALAEALDLLRESVRELIATKRRTTAAAVSLQMRRSSKTFTPAATGFGTFRDFLRFAEGVGAVALLPPVPGGDMEVLSASAVGPSTELSPPTPSPRPVRRDLWQAFVDWSPQWQRAYDVHTGRVVTLPTDANSNDDSTSQSRQAWHEDPARFHRIVPLSRGDQLKWMRDFVSRLPAGAERDQLTGALADEHPLSAFTGAIRALPALQRAWRRNLTDQVTAAITRWILRENITVDIYRMPPTRRDETSDRISADRVEAEDPSQKSSAVSHETDSSDDLREQVLEAVARMPLSELLRLPIPAEYLLRR